MAGNGYVRQSVADIINGENITAPPLNAEFNSLEYAFDGATGHTHDGSIGGAPKIDLTTSITGYLPAVHGGVGGRNNVNAIISPTQLDGEDQGYRVGSVWSNLSLGKFFICVDATNGSAVWHELATVSPSSQWLPTTTDTVDLGSQNFAFKDLYLTGAVKAATLDGELGGATPSAITGTTITSTEGFFGDLSGDVTGDLTGNIQGDVYNASQQAVLLVGDEDAPASFTGNGSGAWSGTFSGTATGSFSGSYTGTLNANYEPIADVGDPQTDWDAVNLRSLNSALAEGTNSVGQYREDAQKLATSPEDQDFNLSTGFYGYSALHYNAKAQQAKLASFEARDSASNSAHIAENAKLIATQKAATISSGLDSKEYRLIGVLI